MAACNVWLFRWILLLMRIMTSMEDRKETELQ
jgi:hypothetical protein